MIGEIVNFVEYLEKDPDIFWLGLKLKHGVYVFLKEEGDQLSIGEILTVNEKTDPNEPLYREFFERYMRSKMISKKSLNSNKKIFLEIGTPFGISFNGKGINKEKSTVDKALQEYFKGVEKYINHDNPEHIRWFSMLKKYIVEEMPEDIKIKLNNFSICEDNKNLEFYTTSKLNPEGTKSKVNLLKTIKDFSPQSKPAIVGEHLEYTTNNGERIRRPLIEICGEPKYGKKDAFFFFMKEPSLEDYKQFNDKYLSKKVFLKDPKKGESFGISNDLTTGNENKKIFLQHRTAPFATSYKVDHLTATRLYKFFRLQRENKILPNPMPIFVDPNELSLSRRAIALYEESGAKKSHREIIEQLIREHKSDLHNFYLIYFNNSSKKTRIADFDFVPAFRYSTDDMPKVRAIYKTTDSRDDAMMEDYQVKNIFDFQEKIINPAFNNQLVKKGSLLYFGEIGKDKPKFGLTPAIKLLMRRYRKSIYDYIYKSNRSAITEAMFHDIMWNSILDDLRREKKVVSIKRKLNIWFSFYEYFGHQKNGIMASKILGLIERCRAIANNDSEHLTNDEEFAFAVGQIIYFLFSKSESKSMNHSVLEPFLQKSTNSQLQTALVGLINTYKHAIGFRQGRFERLAKEVLAYEPDGNLKELQRFILAGYFALPVIYESNTKETTHQN